MEDFDAHTISNFDDGKSGNRNTTGLYSNKTKKMGMNSRNDIFDLRADAIQVE
jgi:hypothetical protein